MRARLSARGAVPPDPARVTLYEKVGDRLVELGHHDARPKEAGEEVKLTYTPTDVGEKVLVIEVPPVPGEADTATSTRSNCRSRRGRCKTSPTS